MSLTTTTDDIAGLLPADYGALVVQPVERQSVAFQASTQVLTGEHTYHLPIISEDATAAWYAEGADLTGDDPTFDELIITPAKAGRVIVISRELAADASPDAQATVGQSIARGLVQAIDAAYFGDLDTPAPKGLEALTGVTTISAGTKWDSLDPFTDAIAEVDNYGSTLTTFVANPTDYATLLRLKKQTDNLEPLLGTDPTQPTKRVIFGVPLLSSPAVKPGTVWGIPQQFSTVVLREDINIEVSRERYFETDQVGIKATIRVGFGFPHQKAIAKIQLD